MMKQDDNSRKNSMREDSYDDDPSSGSNTLMVHMAFYIFLFTAALLAFILYVNRYKLGFVNRNQSGDVVAAATQSTDSSENGISGDTKTANDLDFWDMYPVETSSEAENDGMPTKQATESTENDPATDGHHTQVTDRDGTKEWLTINNYLPKSTIDPTNLVCQENIMKYYEDDKQTSYMGVDVSKYNTYVDYEALKKAGVQFVMIRVGARGYSSGNITMDDYFANNIKQASDAGLDIGLTFFSQAINVEEAQAEAQTVLSSIGEYQVNYPIAIDMEYIPDDTSRIENTNAEQKTTIIKAFCDAIKAAGYNPMIYGDKEWLLKEIHLTKLTGYDVWLAQNEDTPDYPYKFTMWQYATDETIDGISGNANLDISFIDFALK